MTQRSEQPTQEAVVRHMAELAAFHEVTPMCLRTHSQVVERNIKYFTPLLDAWLDREKAKVRDELCQKVDQWHRTCSDYENHYAQEKTHYGCASHIAESYYRGAKEAFSRILNEMDGAALEQAVSKAEEPRG